MWPDAKWLEALNLPSKVVFGVALASLILLLLDYTALYKLDLIWSALKPLLILLLVFSGSITIANAAASLNAVLRTYLKRKDIKSRQRAREEQQKLADNEARATVLRRLNYLTIGELRILGKCLQRNEQSFLWYVHDGSVANLMAKSLVYSPGGTHNQDHYPFGVVDYVWEELVSHRNEFVSKLEEMEQQEASSGRARK